MTEGEVVVQYLNMIHSVMRHKMLSVIAGLKSGVLQPDGIESDNVLFNAYAVLSWAYYREDKSLVPDEVYDKICVELGRRADKENAPRELVQYKESFKAGTGFDLIYPQIIPDVEVTYRVYQFHNTYSGKEEDNGVRKVPASGAVRYSGG